MAETHVVHALKEKRARLAGELHATQLRAIKLKSDIASVDACLRMFRPGIDPQEIESKRTFGKNPGLLPKGAGGRYAVDILRETGAAFTCDELAVKILINLGKEPTPRTVAMLAKTIHSTLSRQKRPLAEFCRDSWPGKWRLKAALVR